MQNPKITRIDNYKGINVARIKFTLEHALGSAKKLLLIGVEGVQPIDELDAKYEYVSDKYGNRVYLVGTNSPIKNKIGVIKTEKTKTKISETISTVDVKFITDSPFVYYNVLHSTPEDWVVTEYEKYVSIVLKMNTSRTNPSAYVS